MKSIPLTSFVLLIALVLSGCVTTAAPLPTHKDEITPTLIYDRLPADYELPPYIRIAALPLVNRTTAITQANTSLLGDYWLFAHTGYTLDVGSLSSIDAANAYVAHHNLDPDAVRLIRFDKSSSVSALYGHFKTREAASQARRTLAINNAQVTSIRALKARRCETNNTPDIEALCNGAPVKTLRIAQVME